MASKNSVLALELTTFNSASLTAAYQAINVNGFQHPLFLLRIVNNATTAITISYDGITDHDYIAPNSTTQIPFQTNGQPNNFCAGMKQGTEVFVKGTAGVGTVAVAGYYQPTQ